MKQLSEQPLFILGRIKEALMAQSKVLDIHGNRKLDAHVQRLCDDLRLKDPHLYNKFIQNELEDVYYRK